MFKQVFLVFFGFVFSFFSVFGFYGDLKVEVFEDGRVSVLGESDFDLIFVDKSHKFTSKEGEFWILNLSLNEPVFEELIFDIYFPYGAQINYLKGKNLKIDTSEDRLKVLGFAENSNLNVLVQYSITDSSVNSNFSFFGYFFSFLFLGVLVLGVVFFVVFKKLKKNVVEIENKIEEKIEREFGIDYSKLNLNERQMEIISILKKYGKVSQKDLEKEMKIPKSSISRNLQSMSAKKIVKIEKSGITNFVSLLENS